jgi:hypothetical protein
VGALCVIAIQQVDPRVQAEVVFSESLEFRVIVRHVLETVGFRDIDSSLQRMIGPRCQLVSHTDQQQLMLIGCLGGLCFCELKLSNLLAAIESVRD